MKYKDIHEPVLLCDFGGTHGRLGILSNKKISDLKKVKLTDFDTHMDLFESYKTEKNVNFSKIAVASAGAHTGMHLSSGLRENTKITPALFKNNGYDLICVLNDFEASAWGAANYQGKIIEFVSAGAAYPDERVRCIIGPGTGLGCAYINSIQDKILIQKTCGGHMRPCAYTLEQFELIRRLQAEQNNAVIYEDMACGRGIDKLYKFFTGQDLSNPAIIFDNPQNDVHAQILKIFHEFLGLYIQNVMVTGNSYGGVILHGGLLDFLHEKELFDFNAVYKMICQPYVQVVEDKLKRAPAIYINNTYLALYGLKNYLEQEYYV